VDDFSRFALHAAMHRVPFLWRLHSTHHSATTLTPFTVFRVHPVESGIYFFRAFITFSLVTGVFVWLFGRHLSIIDVVGVNAIGFIANAAFANLRHSHVWVGFGRLEHYFVSPAQHQLHHSTDLCRGNYGSVLSIWDRLAGTLELSGKRRPLTFGLVSQDRSERSSQPVISSWLSTAGNSKVA
jgi:sterol desaturase/sphingolipid hydroxylase (fatty acid hydroxylase superfamily)